MGTFLIQKHTHIHNYNNCITITDIINFMDSYHGLIQVRELIIGLCLFGTPVGVTELILCRTYTYNRLICLQDSRRSYRTYYCISDIEVPAGTTEHFNGTKVPVGTTEQILYTEVLIGTTGLMLILRIREYS